MSKIHSTLFMKGITYKEKINEKSSNEVVFKATFFRNLIMY